MFTTTLSERHIELQNHQATDTRTCWWALCFREHKNITTAFSACSQLL